MCLPQRAAIDTGLVPLTAAGISWIWRQELGAGTLLQICMSGTSGPSDTAISKGTKATFESRSSQACICKHMFMNSTWQRILNDSGFFRGGERKILGSPCHRPGPHSCFTPLWCVCSLCDRRCDCWVPCGPLGGASAMTAACKHDMSNCHISRSAAAADMPTSIPKQRVSISICNAKVTHRW